MLDGADSEDTGALPPEWGRRRDAALAGHAGDEAAARDHLRDPSARVRATAMAALGRLGALTAEDLSVALADDDPALRRRGCELAAGRPDVDLVPLLADTDDSVAEVAAWALGETAAAGATESGGGPPAHAVEALATMAVSHDDALCREAAVAALGSLGDVRGLPAILAATTDKPAVRRRAVIALAPFDGPEVRAALERARGDRDWQVRQAAEDLSAGGAAPGGEQQ